MGRPDRREGSDPEHVSLGDGREGGDDLYRASGTQHHRQESYRSIVAGLPLATITVSTVKNISSLNKVNLIFYL